VTGPVAYLTGEFPRATDTFIQREIAALRALGLTIAPCTMRPTSVDALASAAQRALAQETYAVQTMSLRPWTLIAAHIGLLVRSPRRWFAALHMAWRTAPPGVRAGLWQAFYFLEAGVLADHLRRIGACRLHNHFADSSCSVALLAARMRGVPFSFTLHGPSEFYAAERWALRDKIAAADFVACISHFARSQAMVFAAAEDWPKLRIVHCGVEPALYAAVQPKPGTRVVFAGRLAGVKGVPILLEALTLVRTAHPDVHLTLVGDGPMRTQVEAQVAALDLTSHVDITGYLPPEAVAERLATADLFVLPSFAEGLPVVLMEALAAGVPVIATQIAGVPELVQDGVTGRLVPPGNVGALATAMSDTLRDPDVARAMAGAGRALVASEFDSSLEARRLAALFTGGGGTDVRPQAAKL